MRWELFQTVILNVSLLVMIAYLLTRLPVIQKLVATDRTDWRGKLILAAVFGSIGILSTYTGVRVDGAILNTRVIGVLAGGILGGPVVGIGAGILAGVQRYAMDVGGFTAFSCGVSTVLEGAIGGLFSRALKRRGNDWRLLMAVAMLAEAVQMGTILLLAKPFSRALALVQLISGPMVLVNSAGFAVFIGIFESVFTERDRELAGRTRLVLDIADRCLPYLRRGLYDAAGLSGAVAIVQQSAGAQGVFVSDAHAILCSAGELPKGLAEHKMLPEVCRQVLAAGHTRIAEKAPEADALAPCFEKYAVVCAPLTAANGERIGSLGLLLPRFKKTREMELEFADGLARLFSTQLALAEVEYQKKMLHRAEFAALQSQINPHFLFNALSTITAFCREKPDRARELLITLSQYFRNTLQTGREQISLHDELEHVNAYLELEKARFEERLQVEIDVPAQADCIVPSFILQPLVENAVKHGAMHAPDGVGRVRISARSQLGAVNITVQDNGGGIPPEIVKSLYAGTLDDRKVGLMNVHKRLLSIYGENSGLRIHTGRAGTKITLRIPAQAQRLQEAI
jgi:two-component system sensor histidine kinase LytS